jgi:hypothetical protein
LEDAACECYRVMQRFNRDCLTGHFPVSS